MATAAKTLTGTVVSTAMNKTITVLINFQKMEKRVHKVVRRSKKLLVHDENGIAKLGDIVTVAECRPLSKRKRHTLLAVIEQKKTEDHIPNI